jgi:hypothetical protein
VFTARYELYLCVLCGSQNKQRLFPFTELTDSFLCAFSKLRKAIFSFVMSVRPSVSSHETTHLPLGGFLLNLIFEYFLKIVENIQFLLKSDNNNGTLHEDLCTFMVICR